jgi:hypothetical protein
MKTPIKIYKLFLPFGIFEGAYSNEPAQSFGLAKHLHRV